jgi:uncharacterized protein (TIGR02284 family)
MPRAEKKCEILNDLLLINRDCSASYQRIIENSRQNKGMDPVLKTLVNIGRDCLLELRRQVDTTFGDPADAVEMKGEIYRTWQQRTGGGSPAMDNDIFDFCERRLNELENAYSRAIQYGSEFSEQVLEMLNMHVQRVRDSFAVVRQMAHA